MIDLTPRYSDLFPDVTDRDDWSYFDIPWCSLEYFDLLFTIAGEGNYLLIVSSEMEIKGETCRRGQVFWSPEARENFKQYNLANKG